MAEKGEHVKTVTDDVGTTEFTLEDVIGKDATIRLSDSTETEK